MAYTVSKPTKSGGAVSTRPNRNGSYSAALDGFANELSSIRKELINQQAAQVDYEIEVGSSDVETKIALYEQYLESLEEGTQEWYRVATKIENLKDTADTTNFGLLKSLYASNQISSDEYYQALKERAAEPGISNKEKQTRLLELKSFEDKINSEATDVALQESLLQEQLGLITAAERYALIEQLYNKEKDPDKKRSLQSQLVSQAKKTQSENLNISELLVRKGINEGYATESDLLPIYQARAQTALTTEDALRAEVAYQDLFQKIQDSQVALFKKNSSEIKKAYKGQISSLDTKIEVAKKTGDTRALELLYETKRGLIDEFWSSDKVIDDDKSDASFINFYQDVYGVVIDPQTGTSTDVGTTAPFNVYEVADVNNNPQSHALVKEFTPGGTKVSVVRGQETQVTKPDGTVASVWQYGTDGNVAVISQPYQVTLKDPFTREVLLNEQGQPITQQGLPVARRVETIQNYGTTTELLRAANKKPLDNEEFKGEYITLYEQDGKPVRQYKVYGDKFARVAGATPIPGEPGAYLLTTFDGEVPNVTNIKAQTQPGPVIQFLGRSQEKINEITGGVTGFITDAIRGQFTSEATLTNNSLQLQAQLSTLSPAERDQFLKNRFNLNLPEVNVPKLDLNGLRQNLAKVFTPKSDLAEQLTSSLFKNTGDIASTLLSVGKKDYSQAVTSGARLAFNTIGQSVINSTPLKGAVDTFTSVKNFASNAFTKVRGFLGL